MYFWWYFSDFIMNNTTLTPLTQPGSVSIMLSLCLVIIGCIIAIMNITVLYAALDISLFQKCAHYSLVLGLTLADTCGALGLISTGVRFLSPELSAQIPLCIITVVLLEVGVFTSFNQTFLICLNRYLLLSKNHWYSKLFDSKCRYVLCALHWTAAIVIATSFFEIESMRNNKKVCNVYVLYGTRYEEFRVVYCSSLLCTVILTVIFYIKTLFTLRRSLHSVAPEDNNKLEMTRRDITTTDKEPGGGLSLMPYQNNAVLRSKEKQNKKTTKIVGIILVALVALTGPMLIVNLIDSVSHSIILITICLTALNSLINPIIYCANIHVLREKIKCMFQSLC